MHAPTAGIALHVAGRIELTAFIRGCIDVKWLLNLQSVSGVIPAHLMLYAMVLASLLQP